MVHVLESFDTFRFDTYLVYARSEQISQPGGGVDVILNVFASSRPVQSGPVHITDVASQTAGAITFWMPSR